MLSLQNKTEPDGLLETAVTPWTLANPSIWLVKPILTAAVNPLLSWTVLNDVIGGSFECKTNSH